MINLALVWQFNASANLRVITSTLLSRPNKVGLKYLSVRPSTKRFFDFNEIYRVGRGP